MRNFMGAQFPRRYRFSYPPKVVLIVLTVIILLGIIFLYKSTKSENSNFISSEKPTAPVVKQKQILGREFNFPIKDSEGNEISKIKYIIQSASLQDDILVKGERARAIAGRTFLILDLKITNSYKQGIQINSRDYVRLIINGNRNEMIAADIHNDPVEVQAISTKLTRIGFPINENESNLEIQVGEINGKKEIVKIEFK